MNYQTAKREVFIKRVAGGTIVVISLVFVFIGLLLFIYEGLSVGSQAQVSLSIAVKSLIYSIFEHTKFLSLIWGNAPAPDFNDIFSKNTLGFLGWYMGVFIGFSLMASANRLARRLRIIDEQIENETIRNSLRGAGRSRAEIERQVTVSKQSVWQQFHTLYIAPLLVGIILWIIAKVIG